MKTPPKKKPNATIPIRVIGSHCRAIDLLAANEIRSRAAMLEIILRWAIPEYVRISKAEGSNK